MENIIPFVLLAGALLAYLLMAIPKDLVNGLALVAFFLPFERIPSLEISDFTLKINHVVGCLLIIFWLLDRFLNNRRQFVANPITPIIWLFISLLVISAAIATLKARAIIFVLLSIFTLLLSLATIDILRTQTALRRIERMIIASAWVVLIFSFWQFLGDIVGLPLTLTGLVEGYSKITFGFPRIQAFSKEPLYLGNYLLLPLGVLIGRLLSNTKKNVSDWLLGFGLLIVFLLTLSRGALVGLGAFILILICSYPRKVLTVQTITISIISLLIVSQIVLAGINLLGPTTKEKFLGHLALKDFNQSESTVSRLSDSQRAIELWQEHPFWGVGLGNFGGSKTDFVKEAAQTQDIVNNEYLELLAETGLVGFGLFLILIGAVLTRSVFVVRLPLPGRESYQTGMVVGLTAALVGMLTQYLFFSTLSIIHIWFTLGLLVASQNIVLNLRSKSELQ